MTIRHRTFSIPELCLVVLVGPPGSGKTTLAQRVFGRYEVLSADAFRAQVSDDENDQVCNKVAFLLLTATARARLRRGRLTVIDATNLDENHRRLWLDMAKEAYVKAVLIMLDLPAKVCAAQAGARASRPLPQKLVYSLHQTFIQARPKVLREKWAASLVLRSVEEMDALAIGRDPLPVRRREESGPFDIIGDVHGCYDELCDLLRGLGYEVFEPESGFPLLVHPQGRKAVFVGDLVDRGPKTPEVLRLVMNSVLRGTALCVLGNHDDKCARALQGKNVKVHEGLARSLAQIESAVEQPSDVFVSPLKEEIVRFVGRLPSHLVLDGGKLVVAHAGLPKEYHGRDTDEVTQVAKYGTSTGEKDAEGHPVRADWAADYHGEPLVVFGHVVEDEVRHVNNTYCIDTGCVFGHKLTALRYPEREVVSVPARQKYIEPDFPFDLTGGTLRARQQAEAEKMRQHFESNLLMPIDAGRRALEQTEKILEWAESVLDQKDPA